jgi:hypothetical protein
VQPAAAARVLLILSNSCSSSILLHIHSSSSSSTSWLALSLACGYHLIQQSAGRRHHRVKLKVTGMLLPAKLLPQRNQSSPARLSCPALLLAVGLEAS